MPDVGAVRLPPLAGRQQESWSAFIELAPALGGHCLLVGGQMVFLLEVERGSLDTRPTDDVDIVYLPFFHAALVSSGWRSTLDVDRAIVWP